MTQQLYARWKKNHFTSIPENVLEPVRLTGHEAKQTPLGPAFTPVFDHERPRLLNLPPLPDTIVAKTAGMSEELHAALERRAVEKAVETVDARRDLIRRLNIYLADGVIVLTDRLGKALKVQSLAE